MLGYYIFDVIDQNRRFRVVYCSSPEPNVDEAITAIRVFSQSQPSADSFAFLVTNSPPLVSTLKSVIQEPEFCDRFPEVTRYFAIPSVHVVPFDHRGRLVDQSLRLPTIEKIVCVGMASIFSARKGLLTVQDGYHYEKPSGKHAQSFMRAGNIMASSAEAVIIKASDAPGKRLSRFVQLVRGHSIIKCQYKDSDESGEQPFRVFLDAERLFADKIIDEIAELNDRFEWLIQQNVPYTLRRIITLSDPASKAMAEALRAKVTKEIWHGIPVIEANTIFSDVERQTTNSGTTIVVASTVSSGRSLHAVSQVLRAAQTNEQLHYLIGFARCPSKDRLNELRTNLTFGSREHGFWLLSQVFLPLSREGREDAWSEV